MSHTPVYSEGPCGTCRRRRFCYRGLCHACRHPKALRPILEAGMPCASAKMLHGRFKKARQEGRSLKETRKLLAFVHPDLMENLRVDAGGMFILKTKDAVWLRRSGWMEAPQRKETPR